MGTEYFRLHPWIGVLSNLPVLAGAAALAGLASPRFRLALERRPAAWIGTAWLLTRVLFLVLIVGLFRHVSLDLSTYFETQGMAVLGGRIPYRDFASSYSPLFPYLMALPAAFRSGVIPFFVFFTLCDLVALGAVWLGTRAGGRGSGPAAAWAYAVAPVTWYFLVRYAQDESLSAAFLAVAWLLFQRRRDTAAALLLGAGCAATKFTFALFIPPFLLASARPWRFAGLSAAAAGALFLPFLLAGSPIWQPILTESKGMGFGPSLWRIPVVFTPLLLGWWCTPMLIVALLLTWRAGAGKLPLDALLLATGCVFLVFTPKMMPMYATPFWPFAAVWLAGSGRPADWLLAGATNLALGAWWYFDAGGIQGQFGPVVVALSVLVTAAIPAGLGLMAYRVFRGGREAGAARQAPRRPGERVLHSAP